MWSLFLCYYSVGAEVEPLLTTAKTHGLLPYPGDKYYCRFGSTPLFLTVRKFPVNLGEWVPCNVILFLSVSSILLDIYANNLTHTTESATPSIVFSRESINFRGPPQLFIMGSKFYTVIGTFAEPIYKKKKKSLVTCTFQVNLVESTNNSRYKNRKVISPHNILSHETIFKTKNYLFAC